MERIVGSTPIKNIFMYIYETYRNHQEDARLLTLADVFDELLRSGQLELFPEVRRSYTIAREQISRLPDLEPFQDTAEKILKIMVLLRLAGDPACTGTAFSDLVMAEVYEGASIEENNGFYENILPTMKKSIEAIKTDKEGRYYLSTKPNKS